jgi:hypothetical protein
MNSAFQWFLENPAIGIFFTVLWMLWVAVALAIICLQIYKHNEREELKEIMRKFDEENRERERKKNSFKPKPPENPDKTTAH